MNSEDRIGGALDGAYVLNSRRWKWFSWFIAIPATSLRFGRYQVLSTVHRCDSKKVNGQVSYGSRSQT